MSIVNVNDNVTMSNHAVRFASLPAPCLQLFAPLIWVNDKFQLGGMNGSNKESCAGLRTPKAGTVDEKGPGDVRHGPQPLAYNLARLLSGNILQQNHGLNVGSW